ncbi:hypothetical protein, partial [Fulvivirga lutimaris]|uniref:hypothetical protein n=1 Tax=Fulvivirga lutimaris TaxID=1819566 RepID=UPI00162485B3
TNYDKRIVPYLLGTEVEIIRENINFIKVVNISECGVGMSISTNLTIADKNWIKQSNLTKTLAIGGIELCGYTLLQYQASSEEAESMIDDLKELLLTGQLHAQNPQVFSSVVKQVVLDKIQELIQKLKKYKVVTIQSCSC